MFNSISIKILAGLLKFRMNLMVRDSLLCQFIRVNCEKRKFQLIFPINVKNRCFLSYYTWYLSIERTYRKNHHSIGIQMSSVRTERCF